MTPSMPTLDCVSEVWLGRFPGLGTIAVAADGSVDVAAEGGSAEDLQIRQRALRYGWAEGLSLVRRGFRLASGAGMVHPETDEATIITGGPHDVAVVQADLSRRGWLALSDRFTPVVWEQDRLVAHPREAPILMAAARAQKCELPAVPARADSDAVIVDLPRARRYATVASVVTVTRRRVGEEVLTTLAGQKRFEAASNLILGGVFSPAAPGTDADDQAASTMADTLRLATLRYCTLRAQLSEVSPDVDEMLRWLATA